MNLEEIVWLMVRVSGSERGRLKLTPDRVSFHGERGTRFDVPHTQISAVKFPWYYFGGGMKVFIGGDGYRFSFVEPHNDHASIRDGRESGARWKAAFARFGKV
jgi:hypothetical protein